MKINSKKQNGFTLIELLATIIIIGIIALITVPSVGGIIERSKKKAYLASMKELIKAGNAYYADNGYTDTSCISANSSDLDFDNKSGELLGEVCYENGEAYLKDVIYNNYVFNGTYSTLEFVEVDNSIKPVFTLNDIVFDGVDDFYDTGYKLFDTSKDFTIVVSVTSTTTTSALTIFHCMNEAYPYPGIVFDQQHIKGRLSGSPTIGPVFTNNMQDDKKILVVKHDATTEKFTYFTLESGSAITQNDFTNSTTSIQQNLLVGAYQNTSGTKGRFFQGTIHHFSLYMDALDDSSIKMIMTNLNN